MQVVRYTDSEKDIWNTFLQNSCNGTFLFHRSFMDYHKDRFTDASLIFSDKGRVKGIFPANIEGDSVFSHKGLTYGGLIWNRDVSSQEVGEMLDTALTYYSKKLQAHKLYYSPVPYIYHSYPASADLYYLFQKGAIQIHSKLSSAIDLATPIPFSTLRRRKVSKAKRQGLSVCLDSQQSLWKPFWNILEEVLGKRHHKVPVHSLEEILLLRERFSSQIKLVTVEKDGATIAGTVLFLCNHVIHTQYIASNDVGCECGALDLLFHTLLEAEAYFSYRYLDFGISTEEQGRVLNSGLLFQKEGFGGRGVCYNDYLIQF